MPINYLQVIIGSALEFNSTNSVVQIHVSGPFSEDDIDQKNDDDSIETKIEVIMGDDRENTEVFKFNSRCNKEDVVQLGNKLAATTIALPCKVIMSSSEEVELTAPIEINASTIVFDAKGMVLRGASRKEKMGVVITESNNVKSNLQKINTNGIDLSIVVADKKGLTYPVIQHTEEREPMFDDKELREKYMRLRHLLMHFCSHSKGALAKYKDAIESSRRLKNEVGRKVLNQLVSDNVLFLSGNFYFLDQEQFSNHLGVTYDDLRKGKKPQSLVTYLKKI